jgi:4-hydroxy-3-polyprenylbenzoate decarboxylase
MPAKKVVVALTGASGAGYGLELIKALSSTERSTVELRVIYNDTALSILGDETGSDLEDIKGLVDEVIHNSVMDHAIASGSNPFDHLVICPCSTSTAAKVHAGISDNLTTRCASVALKEGRDMIMAIRETPISTPILKALYELSSWGVTIMPASPPMYGLTSDSIKDLQRTFAGRILDSIGIENDMVIRYKPG